MLRSFGERSLHGTVYESANRANECLTIPYTRLLLIDTDDVLILHDMIQTNLLTPGMLRRRSPHDRMLELFRDFLMDC